MVNDFKKFLLRGNILELAVAVIIGTAFGAVVASLVKDVLTPIIAAVGGQPNFDSLSLSVGDGVVKYGVFVNALVNFLIVASVMFVILKTVEKMQSMRKTADAEIEEAAPVSNEELLLAEIRDLLADRRETVAV
jgi:large conductance mechanosensitive channel